TDRPPKVTHPHHPTCADHAGSRIRRGRHDTGLDVVSLLAIARLRPDRWPQAPRNGIPAQSIPYRRSPPPVSHKCFVTSSQSGDVSSWFLNGGLQDLAPS